MKQYRQILHSEKRRNMPNRPSKRTYRFGDQTVISLCMVELVLKTIGHIYPIPVLLNIVPVNIPALLGLDILDGYSLLADNVTNRLWHCVVQREDPLEYDDI